MIDDRWRVALAEHHPGRGERRLPDLPGGVDRIVVEVGEIGQPPPQVPA